MQPSNPYAPPQDAFASPQAGFQGFGVWQQGGQVVMYPTGAMLPARCVVCNEPGKHKLGKTFHWHEPWLYLLILAGWLVYAIVAMIVRKSVGVELWLCDQHRQRRTIGLALVWVGFTVGLIGMLVAAGASSAPLAIFFCVLMIGMPIAGAIMARVASVARIDDIEVRLKAGEAFVAALPTSPQQGSINVGFGMPPGPMGGGYGPPPGYGSPGNYGPPPGYGSPGGYGPPRQY